MAKASVQPWLIQQIEHSAWLQSKHHACLVKHPSHAKQAALYLAQQALCQKQGKRPCNQCPSCLAFLREEHPDLCLIAPEKTQTIGVQKIRDSLSVISHSTSLAPRRVILIHSVDAMTIAASNALLKSLEEPPSHCLFILAAKLDAMIMPTIRSRVFMLSLQQPSLTEFQSGDLPLLKDEQIQALDYQMPLITKAVNNLQLIEDYQQAKQVVSHIALGRTFAVGQGAALLQSTLDPMWVIQAWLRDTYRHLCSCPIICNWPLFYSKPLAVNATLMMQVFTSMQHYLIQKEASASFNQALALDQILLELRQITKGLQQ